MILMDAELPLFINSLRQRGIEVTSNGDQLQVTWDPSEPLTSADRQFIRQHKTELLNMFNLEKQESDYLGEIQKEVSSWPEPRQRQLDSLAQADQDPHQTGNQPLSPRNPRLGRGHPPRQG